jgi:hypothetical protein
LRPDTIYGLENFLAVFGPTHVPKSISLPNSTVPIPETQTMIRLRLTYITTAILVIVAGLASRQSPHLLPPFMAEYAGDTLWALVLFLLISTMFAGTSLAVRTATALAIAFLVEISQLYHAPWIDSIRQTRLGGYALGHGFLWTDLICYTVGIASGACTEGVFVVRTLTAPRHLPGEDQAQSRISKKPPPNP